MKIAVMERFGSTLLSSAAELQVTISVKSSKSLTLVFLHHRSTDLMVSSLLALKLKDTTHKEEECENVHSRGAVRILSQQQVD